MRPGSLDSLRGIQAALAESIVPQLTSAYGQDVAGTLQMLVESLASEWDTLVEDLVEDNRRMRQLLAGAAPEIQPFSGRNESITRLVKLIEEPSAGPDSPSLRLSALTAENDRLRGELEALIVALEGMAPDPEYASLLPLRAAVYKHLRRVAASGWSFWDVASFRERMAAIKSDISG